jgi:GT2 family glycosyltransferase
LVFVSTLAVVIPTTHWVSEVTNLVKSIHESSPIDAHVFVVDNGPEANAEDWPSDLNVFIDTNYLGSGGAFAAGAARAVEIEPSWTLLLDHDAILASETISAFLDIAEKDSVGVYVARAYGAVWAFESWRGPRYDKPVPGDSLVSLDFGQWSGFLLPAAALEELSNFNCDYFFGWDDYRFSAELRRRGYVLRGVPWVVVENRRRPGQWESAWRRYYGARNRILLSSDLYGRWSWGTLRATATEVLGMRHEPQARARGIRDGLLGHRGQVVIPE